MPGAFRVFQVNHLSGFQIFYPLNGSLQFVKHFRSPFVDKALVLVLCFRAIVVHRVLGAGILVTYADAQCCNQGATLRFFISLQTSCRRDERSKVPDACFRFSFPHKHSALVFQAG